MPYMIISTVALVANLYRNAPIIVGDKDSDPELMKCLGAQITTNYPACGSPPTYILHAPPRRVLEQLEKYGYYLVTSQIVQEHCIWFLRKIHCPLSDAEIDEIGPNDKKIQTSDTNTVQSNQKIFLP